MGEVWFFYIFWIVGEKGGWRGGWEWNGRGGLKWVRLWIGEGRGRGGGIIGEIVQGRGRVGLWLDNMSVCGWDGTTFVDNLPYLQRKTIHRLARIGKYWYRLNLRR